MTTATELLAPERVRCSARAGSKKRALEMGAGLLSGAVPSMSRMSVFEALNTRERLGSTGLGHGMALPHGRVRALAGPVGACFTLAQAIDFDAPDGQPVDLLFFLLVPRDCSEDHLQILATLAEMFNDARLREALRHQTEPSDLVATLQAWTSGTSSAAASQSG